ncbi:MAG: sugar phosphate isomerase/epimerase [Oscillospiraceae bacterium]|nr:sugar phosphate isomerase/epimerase [Oscillospiraceae bacterium]
MNSKYLIIPDFSQREKSEHIAQKYSAAFEYNDFFLPEVYCKPGECERRIEAYLSMERDRSEDTLHGVFYDITPNSPDPYIAERSLHLMEQSIGIAERLSCRGVVFHSGIISGLRLPSYKESWLNGMEKIYRRLCREHPHIAVFLENSTEQEPEMLIRIAERMADVPNFRLCLDYAHAILTKTEPEVWVKEMGAFLGHIHLNDNDGISDLHRVPGDGSIDLSRFFSLKKHCFPEIPVLLEVTGAEASEKALEYILNFKA